MSIRTETMYSELSPTNRMPSVIVDATYVCIVFTKPHIDYMHTKTTSIEVGVIFNIAW